MYLINKIDANWIDSGVILFGFLGVFYKPFVRKILGYTPCYRPNEIAGDFGYFGGLFLAIILMLSPLSSELLTQLTSASKPTLALGGLVCAVSFIREIAKIK